jgi:hypothetical protein
MSTHSLIAGLIALAMLSRAAAAEVMTRVYITLSRPSYERVVGMGLRNGQEEALVVYPRRGDSFVVVLKPLVELEGVSVGVRFYKDVSEVEDPAPQKKWISCAWNTATTFSIEGASYVLVASREKWIWPSPRAEPPNPPEPQLPSVMSAAEPRVAPAARAVH